MAKYGLDFYGVGRYGNPTTISFDASPFLSESKDYGKIELSWLTPVDDATVPELSVSKIRLVRNPKGFPETVVDGDILFGSDDAPILLMNSKPSWLDTVPEGRYYYYALFVSDQAGTWHLAGTVEGLSVKDYGISDYLFDTLPTPYKATNLFDWRVPGVNQQLVDFLSIFGFQFNAYRTEIAILTRPFNLDTIKARLVPTILSQYGHDYEPSTSAYHGRRLAKNATYINKWRGTKTGIVSYVESFSGWGCSTTNGKNVLLDRNDASGEESPGRWTPLSYCSVGTRRSASPLLAYEDPGSPSGFPNRTAGMIQITVDTSLSPIATWGDTSGYTWGDSAILWGGRLAAGSTAAAVSLPNPNRVKLEGAPVLPGKDYSFTLRMARIGVARTATPTITWYTSSGSAISSTSGAAVAISTDWSSQLTVNATSPATAMWASIAISIAAVTNGETFFIDCVQVEQSTASTYYEDPRTVNIKLLPVRENLIHNPIFDSSIFNWKNDTAAAPTTDIATSTDVGTVRDITYTKSLKYSEASKVSKTGIITTSYTASVTSNTALTFSYYLKTYLGTSLSTTMLFSDGTSVSHAGTTPQKVQSVTNKVLTSNVATLTCAAHGYAVGDSVYITDIDATFNTASLTKTTITAVTTNTFSYAKTAGNVGTSAATGKVSKWYRHYMSAKSPEAPDVITASLTSNVVTLTTEIAHGFVTGSTVTVSGIGAPFDGTYVLTGAPTSTTMTYARVWANVAAKSPTEAQVDGLRTVKLSVTLTGATSTVGYIDAAMLEPLGTKFVTVPVQAAELAPGIFLCGNSNYGDTADVLWTGTALDSTSAWYPNRIAKYYRLRTTLTDHIPAGADFRITFAPRFGS